MGFLDKLKAAAAVITGSSADVTLSPGPLVRGVPMPIDVKAVIGPKDVMCAGVYLKVAGLEEVEVPATAIRAGQVGGPVHAQSNTFEMTRPVAEAQVLQAGRAYEWTVEITLPLEVPPLYEGPMARHRIRAMAGIDCTGNDPDSGWVDLRPA
ncbi:MAG: hypothetical protein HKN29_15440 [Rhodothermales bacterium]|nr:hypothetical protein [Rhodothermales bacterium]